jgi:glycosyltransferase involved in cell wall biosynthesis
VLHFDIATAGISSTQFQADTFPQPFRDKISVLHDGIDTAFVRPNPQVKLQISENLTLTRDDRVISLVNRNLGPYRGGHTFFWALPQILWNRPNVQVIVVGEDGVSYGSQPPKGTTWKQKYIDEVRPDIADADWARVHLTGRISYDKLITALQVNWAHIYLTYPFVLSWSLIKAMSAGAAIIASEHWTGAGGDAQWREWDIGWFLWSSSVADTTGPTAWWCRPSGPIGAGGLMAYFWKLRFKNPLPASTN